MKMHRNLAIPGGIQNFLGGDIPFANPPLLDAFDPLQQGNPGSAPG